MNDTAPLDLCALQNEIAARSKRFRTFDDRREMSRYMALALAGEVGEMLNIVKKEWRGDPKGLDGDALLDASCEPGSRVRPAPAEDDEIEARIAERPFVTDARDARAYAADFSPMHPVECFRLQGRSMLDGDGCRCFQVGVFLECLEEARRVIRPPVAAPAVAKVRRPAELVGDFCQECGSPNMTRAGTCMVCRDCGSTSGGCS